MRKISVYSLLFLGFLVASCGSNGGSNSNTANAESEAAAPEAERMMAAMPAPAAGQHTIPAPQGGNAKLFSALMAKDYSDNYAAVQQKLRQNSFVFESQQLLDYINNSNSTILNFVLGANQAYDSLFLFVAPVGRDGRHVFYNRNDSFFVLAETHAVAIPTTLETQPPSIDTFFVEAMDVNTAQAMIGAYGQAGKMPIQHGWLYNARDLAGYLQAGINAGGMLYTQIILSLDKKGIPHLIIVGSNDGVNHMYFEFNQNQCIMENSVPCPQCDIASGGSTFDPPQNSNRSNK
jgi:hypothetical protein